MDLINHSFVDQLKEPLTIVDVVPGSPSRYHECMDGDSIKAYFEAHDQYSSRILFICQRTSWRPLQLTKGMADSIVSQNKLGPSFWDLASCFYTRNLELEETYMKPITESHDGPWREISYSIRYPELKPNSTWTMRQSAVVQRLNIETRQSISVLFLPTPNDAAFQAIRNFLESQPLVASSAPLWLHEILFSIHLPTWRQYFASLEHGMLQIANTMFSTYIDEPLLLGYDNLSTLVGQTTKCLKAKTVLDSTHALIKEIIHFMSHNQVLLSDHLGTSSIIPKFQNHLRECAAYSRSAEYMHRRSQTTAQHLSDTLSFRNQVISKEQNGNMLRLNKSAVFITKLSMLYLPASLVAGFFGMNFFNFDEESSQIVATPMIWIFILATSMLALVTWIVYYLPLHHKPKVIGSLNPRPDISGEWKRLVQRFTKPSMVGDK